MENPERPVVEKPKVLVVTKRCWSQLKNVIGENVKFQLAESG